jgi:hypothetical protein
MSRRISPREFFRTASPLIAASLAAGLLSGPTLVQAQSEARNTAAVVALADVASELDRFGQLFAVADAQADAHLTVFERAFGVPKKKVTAPVTTSALPAPAVKQIMVADADPYFERWQKDANQRLQEENTVRTVKQHPLAAANPEKSVVVCEAGCRSGVDEIVYINALVSARPETGQLQLSSSDTPAASAGFQPIDSHSAPCIAGCYDAPELSPAAPHRKAADIPAAAAPVKMAAAAPIPAKTRQERSQRGFNGAIIETLHRTAKPVQHAAHRSIAKAKPIRVAVARGWRTKVISFVPPVQKRTGLVRAVRHAKSAVGGKWRTTVRVAPVEATATVVRYRVTAW